MADHVISLNGKQEDAVKRLIAQETILNPGSSAPTPDEWMKRYLLAPIKQEIQRYADEMNSQVLQALPDATVNQLAQIKAILNIP